MRMCSLLPHSTKFSHFDEPWTLFCSSVELFKKEFTSASFLSDQTLFLFYKPCSRTTKNSRTVACLRSLQWCQGPEEPPSYRNSWKYVGIYRVQVNYTWVQTSIKLYFKVNLNPSSRFLSNQIFPWKFLRPGHSCITSSSELQWVAVPGCRELQRSAVGAVSWGDMQSVGGFQGGAPCMNSSNDRITYRVAKTHTMPQIACHFPPKSIFRKRATNYMLFCRKRHVIMKHPMRLRHPVSTICCVNLKWIRQPTKRIEPHAQSYSNENHRGR